MSAAEERDALHFYLHLLERRFALTVRDGRLIVNPGSRLDLWDIETIQRHRDALVRLTLAEQPK